MPFVAIVCADPVKTMRAANIRVKELRNVGCSVADLRTGGYSAQELCAIGCDAGELSKGGFTGKQLRDVGFSATQLKEAGLSVKELRTAARFSAVEVRELAIVAALVCYRLSTMLRFTFPPFPAVVRSSLRLVSPSNSSVTEDFH